MITSPVNINDLSPEDLAELISAAKERQRMLAERPDQLTMRKMVSELCEKHGWTLGELLGEKKRGLRASRSPSSIKRVAPKYRSPYNPEDTWTGRGKPPRWMKSLLDMGKDASDFLISREAPGA